MLLFIFLYFLILIIFQIFIYIKLKYFISFSSIANLLYILFSTIFILSPFLIRFFEKIGLILISIFLSHFFYLFLSYSFTFSFFFILFLPLNFYKKISPFLSILNFFLPSIIILLGFYQNEFLKVKKYDIKSKKLEKNLKVGFISDLHFGLVSREKMVKEIIEIFEREKIDLLLCGGDLLDSSYLKNGLEIIKNYNPPLGKFAVLGNHEFYVGIEKSIKIMEELGFKVLRFEKKELDGIVIAGADDDSLKYFRLNYDEEKFIESLPEDKFIIYLKHRPPEKNESKINLFLCGHTHRGQFFPFSIITLLFFKYHYGLYKIGDDNFIYVSSGAGSWGPQIRFLTFREVLIFNLLKF